MMIQLTPIVSRSKTKWYKQPKNNKLALNSQLHTYQILTNDDQMLNVCLSHYITTVMFTRIDQVTIIQLCFLFGIAIPLMFELVML